MRKIFTLFAAMLVAAVVFAADQYPDPKVTNSLAEAFSAVGDGETVYLDDSATYVNIKGNDYTYIQGGKNFTVKAKDGENPVIRFAVPFRIKEASSAKFIGIKFEVDSMKNYDNLFYFKDSTNNGLEFESCEFAGASSAVSIISVPSKYMAASIVMKDCYFHHNANRAVLNQGTLKKLTIIDSKFFKFTGSDHPVIDNYASGISEKYQIEGCEFDSITEQVVRGGTGAHLDSCIIDNSIFLNSANSAVKFPTTGKDFHACNVLKVSNSTFANFKKLDASLISFANKSGTEVKDAELRVDHCTFYNLELVDASYSYGFIDSRKSSNVLVSNCIFANPTSGQSYATYCYGGAIDTCLIYNTNGHRSGSCVVTGSIEADPLFVDAANGDYTLSYGSPALDVPVAENRINLGDPRWVPAPKTLYCEMKQGWWTDAGAAIGCYAYYNEGEYKNAEWPGVRMTPTGEDGVWTYDVSAKYDHVIFTRMNPSDEGTQDWGYKSYELAIPEEWDYYTITSTSAPGDKKAEGTWKKLNPTFENGWYLIGVFDGVEAWTNKELSADRKFTLNSGHEFMLTTALVEGDEFKAGYVYYDQITDIKPEGDNYVVDAAHAGTTKTIYFNEAGEGGDGWFAKTFYVEKNSATAIDNTVVGEKAVKVLRNGQLFIEKDGKIYNVLGTVVK